MRAPVAVLASLVAVLVYAGQAHADVTWERSFGKGVGGPGIHVCTLATSCVAGDTSGTSGATLADPADVAIDQQGNTYVADYAQDRVVKFDHNGNFVRTWGWGVNPAQPGAFGSCLVEANCLSGSDAPQGGALNGPAGIAVSKANRIYVTEYDGQRISQFDENGAFIRTIGYGVNGGSDYEACPAANAANCETAASAQPGGAFRNPRGIAFDDDGDWYVAEWGGARVSKFDAQDTFVWTVGYNVLGNGTNSFKCTVRGSCFIGSENGVGGGFWTPDGIGVGADDTVWVADRFHQRVSQFTSEGDWVKLWGKGVLGDHSHGFEVCTVRNQCNNGAAGSGPGEFNQPSGIDAHPNGLIYVSERLNHRIQAFTGTGSLRETIGAQGTQGGELGRPAGLETTADDELVVAEADAHRVSRFAIPVTLPAPTVLAVTPAGPANQNTIRITGTAPSGADVRIWKGAECTAGIAATGTAEEFASPGVAVTVPDDSTTTFSAQTVRGNSGSSCSSTSVSYTEDSTPPETFLDSGDGSASSTPTFLFHADDATATFTCRIDGAPFGPCFGTQGSHVIPSPLSPGPHTFEVVATDAVGNADPTPAIARVNVAAAGTRRDPSTPLTTITSGPEGFTSAAPSWTFTSSIPGSTFECRMDAAAFEPCASGKFFYHLRYGDHRFYVRAVSPGGVRDPDPPTRAFRLGETRFISSECTGSISNFGSVACPFVFPADVRCPVGAVCTMDGKANAWRENIERAVVATVGVGFYDERSGRSEGRVSASCDSSPDWYATFFDTLPESSPYHGEKIAPACPRSVVTSGFGSGQRMDASCGAAMNVRGPFQGYEIPKNFVLGYRCSASFKIVPAAPLDVLADGATRGTAMVPGAGILAASTSSTTRSKPLVVGAAAKRKKRVPLIKAVKVKAKAAGTVTVPFKLSATAKKTLKKKGRLKLPLTLKFTPTGSKKATTRKVTVTLTR